jgi:probable HAF family extracellular repeat protein
VILAAAVLGLLGPTELARSAVQQPGGLRNVPPTRLDPYVLTPLGTEATAIDAQGDVAVNQSTLANLFVPVSPNSPDGNLISLGTLGGTTSIGRGINDVGHVVGYSTLGSGSYRGFLWDGSAMVDIGTLGADYSSATSVSAYGHVVGSSYDTSDNEHGFLWTPHQPNGNTGSMIDLGTLGGEYSAALAVDTRGVVVGYAYTAAGAFHAFRWQSGMMTDLGTLGGSYSRANAIDDHGRIVGQAYLSGNVHAHACLWDGGVTQDLGNLGGNYSGALGIDPSGERIVGTATVPSGDGFLHYHAFLFENGTMTDLNALIPPVSGWVLEEASAVNQYGQIVGRGTLGGQPRGFLLTPR